MPCCSSSVHHLSFLAGLFFGGLGGAFFMVTVFDVQTTPDFSVYKTKAPPMVNSGMTALEGYLKYLDNIHNTTPCPLGTKSFVAPKKHLGDYLKEDGRAFLVGDSVISQLCFLGKPGLCCNTRYPCDAKKTKDYLEDEIGNPEGIFHPEMNVSHYGLRQDDWQHFVLALGRGNTYLPPTFMLAPSTNPQKAPRNAKDGGVGLLEEVLYKVMNATEDDILVMGLAGNHWHNEKEMPAFEEYANGAITKIANKFPGRVVLLGASPQHFYADGLYTSTGIKKCSAYFPRPTEYVNAVEARITIWNSNIRQHLNHSKTRNVDVAQTLSNLWMCHRYPNLRGASSETTDCLHWSDGVYALLAGLVLQAIQQLSE